MIEILRLNHRVARDKRLSTHVALTARAFGATKIYYSGQKDSEMELSINKITNKFGGPFEIEHIKNGLKLVKEKKGFNIVHLTMYGAEFEKKVGKIKGDVLVIVGGEKVEGEYYELADYNVGVGNQPHSEAAALGVFLYKLNGIKSKFKGAKIIVEPCEKGKLLKEQK
jgi:tRNA (cytidine56-2'-O)-methyltransferase